MSLDKKTVFDAATFDQSLDKNNNTLKHFQQALEHGRHVIRAHHFNHGEPEQVVSIYAWLVDQLLQRAWQQKTSLLEAPNDAAFIAVGGYGRGELHPSSDIDLMILLEKKSGETIQFAEALIQFLWDIGLEVGHSTRLLQDCVKEARIDITVATNIMESRLLAGNIALFESMKKLTNAPKLWPSKKFFSAKLGEQNQRHKRFGDTAYNLEPNVKEGPGGLRDIQMILWVAQRHYDNASLESLVEYGVLSKQEYDTLAENRNLLWSIRNSLHFISGRREDRLLFDYQRTLAEHFGYKDKNDSLAVEQFMKHYYRAVKELSVLNEILLQNFDETILSNNREKMRTINGRFDNLNGYLSVKNDDTFRQYPESLLELFLLLQLNTKLKGVRARTIRLLRANLDLIDDSFRSNPKHKELFMDIIRQPTGVTHELRRMNAYGVLGAYIPEFGNIVGQMQHDLFHVYTVDEHTLFVVRNIRRFTVPEYTDEFPLASSVINHLLKPERLYIAGLFHDIAKGRGGDHSVLGAVDANAFCKNHGLNDYDTRLVCWLVEHHLIMSWVSQREDISDPMVINNFAQKVGDQEHLDNLYLFTVADIRGTSPKLWNEWKGHLLAQLYKETSRLFARGIDTEIDAEQHIAQRKTGALELLNLGTTNQNLLTTFWDKMENNYFLGYEPNSLAWHGRIIAEKSAAEIPVVATRFNPEIGGTEFLFYTSGKTDVLVRLTCAFDKLNLSIVDARIHTSFHGFMLTTFVVLDANAKAIKNKKLLADIEHKILDELLARTPVPRLQLGHVSRQLKHFPIETRIAFSTSDSRNATIMEVIAQDRPGLLYQVASVLYHCKVKLVAAKISTFGERAEDIFLITDQSDQAITDQNQLDQLSTTLNSRLQPNDSNVRQVNF